MLRDLIPVVAPLLGSWCYSQPRLSEYLLLGLLCFCLGCCCGGILVGLLISARCRVLAARLVNSVLEDPGPVVRGPRIPRDRLLQYRMSQSSTTVHIEGKHHKVVVTVQEAAPSDHQNSASSGPSEWEVVEEILEKGELAPSRHEPPLHLLRRSRLSTVGEWTPERRLVRAFDWGKADAQTALDSSFSGRQDKFPLASAVYVILYDPSGEWPRYTRSVARFYAAVKDVKEGKVANRSSPWRPGIVSRGFPSLVEAESYLLGATCQLPSAEF